LISRPALRRRERAVPLRQEKRQAGAPSVSLTQVVAALAAFLGGLAWRSTSDLTRTGFARLVSHLSILSVTLVALVMGAASASSAVSQTQRPGSTAPGENTSITLSVSTLTDFSLPAAGGALFYNHQSDIVRQADPFTVIPNRPRRGVIEYTVQTGDALFTIASRFGVTPETILWNNQATLTNDAGNIDPHKILPGTVLIIPPVSGIIHTIQDGDTLEGIAAEYKVTVDAIVVDGASWNNLLEGRLPPVGSTLVVPGGQKEFKGWELPRAVARNGAGSASVALGQCANTTSGGLQGSTSFMWPTHNHWVSGYNYSAWHRGLDLAGRLGDPVYASDSGFIVYAGWSNVGYGNLIVVDHGNGWQTWYAHLSQILVTCGQDVYQGTTIGAVGSTGNASGPHLHFETRYMGDLPNPFNVLPAP